jgi:malto-oligosyltrehalose trehalohydrolase
MSDQIKHVHEMPFGAHMQADGKVRFRLWAPGQRQVSLVLEADGKTLPMTPLKKGWHEAITNRAAAGGRYRFKLEDGLQVPDPASRYQPDDVHGPSEVIDPRGYRWSHGDWRGRPWEASVIYELHVGTFSEQGTFRAAIEKLDYLVDLGITVIELMPIADFPGARNWGYDGVLPYAPDSSYGRPEDLKALIDAAHSKGLMVFLDVVYNHFGPDGNYLPSYAPQVFTTRHKTPWGNAINYDGSHAIPVREFMIHNALYWIEEYRFDGLRLDAVHAIIDEGSKHLLEELAERVRASTPRRHVHLILENEENHAHWLARTAGGEAKNYTAQWNDDVHHGLHTAATGERSGYYAEYQGDIAKLARALAEGFAFQGETMEYRGSPRGQASGHLPPVAFVAFMQNHDQVGNRAFGDRLTHFAPAEAVRAVAALYLLCPQIPMLFMGEEWAAAQPFPFFCDFDEELAQAVRHGRREEFAKFPEFQDPQARERIPDPTAEDTFRSAKLAWGDRDRQSHIRWLDWYRQILATRKAEITPRLAGAPGGTGLYKTYGDSGLRVRWRLGDDTMLTVLANLSDHPIESVGHTHGRVFWQEGPGSDEAGDLGPWSVVWIQESRAIAGS